jgi:hypothetical protein
MMNYLSSVWKSLIPLGGCSALLDDKGPCSFLELAVSLLSQ